MAINFSTLTVDQHFFDILEDKLKEDFAYTGQYSIPKGSRSELFRKLSESGYLYRGNEYKIYLYDDKENPTFVAIVYFKFMEEELAHTADDDPFWFHVYCKYEDIEKWKKFILNMGATKTEVVREERYLTNWNYITTQGSLSEQALDITMDDKFYPELYPHIPNVDQYIDDYMKSKSSILLMLGPPGLGKSSLIRYFLKKTRWINSIVYDERVMRLEEFYVSFLKSSKECLIMEDADILMLDRESDQNVAMNKILNVSDGIINLHKKIIFTANIENKDKIDKALIRPGRCFDILEFRPLTKAEAEIAAKAVGTTLKVDKKEYNVAEIFSGKASYIPQKLGF